MSITETNNTIEDLRRKYVNAVTSFNVAAIVQLYSDKPRFLPPEGDIPRWEAPPNTRWFKEYINTYWQNLFQITGNSAMYVQTMRDFEVVGEVAHEIGIYDLRVSNNENELRPEHISFYGKRKTNNGKFLCMF